MAAEKQQYVVIAQSFCSAQQRLTGHGRQNLCRKFLRNWKHLPRSKMREEGSVGRQALITQPTDKTKVSEVVGPSQVLREILCLV